MADASELRAGDRVYLRGAPEDAGTVLYVDESGIPRVAFDRGPVWYAAPTILTRVTPALPSQAGCWVSGGWGWRGACLVIDNAIARGFHITRADRAIIDAHAAELADHTEVCCDLALWIAEDAERWLNDNVAPDGYAFGWHDGEFFLWSEEEWRQVCC